MGGSEWQLRLPFNCLMLRSGLVLDTYDCRWRLSEEVFADKY